MLTMQAIFDKLPYRKIVICYDNLSNFFTSLLDQARIVHPTYLGQAHHEIKHVYKYVLKFTIT